MTMDVNEANNGIRLPSMCQDVVAKCLDLIYCWMQLRVWCQKLAIQIIAGQGSAVISRNHTIRVGHGNDLEDDPLTEVDSLLALTSDELEEALHYIASIRLARMDTCANNHILLVLVKRLFTLHFIKLGWVYFDISAVGLAR